jgi:hypothetical protein
MPGQRLGTEIAASEIVIRLTLTRAMPAIFQLPRNRRLSGFRYRGTPLDRPSQPHARRLQLSRCGWTLRFDLTVKAAIYARAGIAEYWVLDVNGRRMIVHRDPTPAG